MKCVQWSVNQNLILLIFVDGVMPNVLEGLGHLGIATRVVSGHQDNSRQLPKLGRTLTIQHPNWSGHNPVGLYIMHAFRKAGIVGPATNTS